MIEYALDRSPPSISCKQPCPITTRSAAWWSAASRTVSAIFPPSMQTFAVMPAFRCRPAMYSRVLGEIGTKAHFSRRGGTVERWNRMHQGQFRFVGSSKFCCPLHRGHSLRSQVDRARHRLATEPRERHFVMYVSPNRALCIVQHLGRD